MHVSRNTYLLFNPVFLSGLILLALNDHYLKWQNHNWLTGKISDFAGLLIFPFFLSFLFPRVKNISTIVTGLIFIYWKLPVSDGLIDWLNKAGFVHIARTVDYTDLLALTVLPLSYFLIHRAEQFSISRFNKIRLHPALVLIPCSMIFMATSMPLKYYMKPNGDIHIGKIYKIKMTRDKVLEKLQAAGYTVKIDSAKLNDSLPFKQQYLIENVVLPGEKDTIKSVEFGLWGSGEKTLFLLNNVNLGTKKNLSDWRELKMYTKYYRKLIRDGIIEEIK